MNGKRLWGGLCVIWLLAGLPAPAFAADDALAQAKQYMAAHDAKRAYALLKPQEAQRAGNPQFDYLLGIAALDSGHPTEAVFALERVLTAEPKNTLARAEIARAYYALGEMKSSKQEFETVKKEGVPKQAIATIDRYLNAIGRTASADHTTVHGYVQATLGHDSNVNSGPGIDAVALPAFGGAIFNLNAGSTGVSDNFLTLDGGINAVRPLPGGVSVFGALNLSKRWNNHYNDFETSYWDGNVGASFKRGYETYTIGAQGNQFFLHDKTYRHAYGLYGQWTHEIGPRTQTSAYVQYARLSYPGQHVRDADRTVIGAAYAHAFPDNDTTVYASAYVGREVERENNVPWIGNHLYGVKAGAQHFVTDAVALFVNAAAERRNYGGEEPFFLTTRHDTQISASAGLTWAVKRVWRVTPQITWINDDSNVAIYDFRRTVYAVTLRRDF
ncbi:MAG TPA: surface lipoprotein assembly modifier [Burkholderiales bacterium]|nr:surface lipoprotein assembly modifier [Burkholderiales bacterium]